MVRGDRAAHRVAVRRPRIVGARTGTGRHAHLFEVEDRRMWRRIVFHAADPALGDRFPGLVPLPQMALYEIFFRLALTTEVVVTYARDEEEALARELHGFVVAFGVTDARLVREAFDTALAEEGTRVLICTPTATELKSNFFSRWWCEEAPKA